MSNQPKVSIIIPIYNVETYLRRCVDSVLNQTLKDIEIILATDGPDACDKICQDYAQQDSRVKILFHPGSYGKAFNKGMEIATGKYIGIVEADDWCAPTMFEKMYNLAEKENADVVKCGFFFAFDDESMNYTVLHNQYDEKLDIFKQPEFISSQPSVWSCIYKKAFLIQNDIEMINDRMSFIDVPFHYETICKASKYILLKEPLYYYYQGNPNQSVQNVKPLDGLKSEIHAISLINKKPKLFDQLKEGLIYSIVLHLSWNYSRLNEKDKDIFLKYAYRFAKNLDMSNLKYIYFNKDQKKFLSFITEPKPFKHKITLLLKKIFSVDNEDTYKRITIFGKKIKIKSKKLIIASLQRNIESKDYLITKQNESLSEKSNIITTQQDALDIKKSKINFIEQELTNKNSLIKEQNQIIETHKKDLSNLSNDLEQKKNQLQVQNDDIKHKDIILENLKEEIKKHLSSLEDKDVLLSNLNQELKEKDNQIEDGLKALNEHAKLLQILTNDIEQKNSILNMQIKDITKKENIINDINKEKVSLQEEKDQLLLTNKDYKRTKDFVNCFATVLNPKTSDDILPNSTPINTANNKQLYSENFYKINAEESFDSAKKIIDIFMKYYKPKSVLDIGCGVGTWLKAWQEASATKVLGIDTNEMPENALYIPRKDIKIFDFEVDKVDIEDKFDLAMSLECFEHITKKHEDNAFNLLINSADIILFSAAIPFQVGTNHINCHKLAYWVDKFKQNNYKCYDIIRPECLKRSLDVGPWYIQNILVFAKNDKAAILEACGANPVENPIMFYHSKMLQDILNENR